MPTVCAVVFAARASNKEGTEAQKQIETKRERAKMKVKAKGSLHIAFVLLCGCFWCATAQTAFVKPLLTTSEERVQITSSNQVVKLTTTRFAVICFGFKATGKPNSSDKRKQALHVRGRGGFRSRSLCRSEERRPARSYLRKQQHHVLFVELVHIKL